MSSFTFRMYAISYALAALLPSAAARAMWLPEQFNPDASFLERRDTATCSTDPSLTQCPSDFPPNFCCPAKTACLRIETGNASVTAAICCPAGSSCKTINTVSCNEVFQDATQVPTSQLHVIPPQQLGACDSGCCPVGYSCNGNNQCLLQVPLSAASGSTSTASGKSSTPTSGSTSAPTTGNSHPLDNSSSDSSGTSFNGKSFAAGFVPGIAIGAIIAALLVLLCIKKRREKSETYNEKSRARDTLTDLGTWRPTMRGRSISEPTVDPAYVTRTDFLRSTPPRTVDSNDIIANSYNVDASGPKTPAHRTPVPIVKALFSRSPFMNQAPSTPPMTQAPMPAHLKRGTLSFNISPIRALKKQKSMHSLRRQMTNTGSNQSTETIQVLMPNNDPWTPDERTTQIPEREGPTLGSAKYQPPDSAITWPASTTTERRPGQQSVTYASSSRYPSEMPQMRMPTPPPPLPGQTTARPSFLDSPYTPTKTQSKGATGGLAVPGGSVDVKRDTTFSALMEKAGLRKSELVMGTKKRVDGKFGW